MQKHVIWGHIWTNQKHLANKNCDNLKDYQVENIRLFFVSCLFFGMNRAQLDIEPESKRFLLVWKGLGRKYILSYRGIQIQSE